MSQGAGELVVGRGREERGRQILLTTLCQQAPSSLAGQMHAAAPASALFLVFASRHVRAPQPPPTWEGLSLLGRQAALTCLQVGALVVSTELGPESTHPSDRHGHTLHLSPFVLLISSPSLRAPWPSWSSLGLWPGAPIGVFTGCGHLTTPLLPGAQQPGGLLTCPRHNYV